MQQLVRNQREAKSMYKLISDIYENGWYPQSIVTLTYNEKTKKFVAWDGNRRLTAVKILKNPQLIEFFKYFSYTQRRSIYAMGTNIKKMENFQIPCYVSNSFEECAGYIKNIHTTDTGALKWDTASIKRFEDKMGRKNLFSQLQRCCPKAFEGIESDFSVNKFERIVSSKVGKKYLDISFNNNILMPLSSTEELETKVSRIVKDIANVEMTGNIIKTNDNIEKYLKGELKNNTSNIEEDQIEINRLVNKVKLIRKENSILFKNINCSKLMYNNERAKGIKDLCYEIQHLSFGNLYKSYPIAYCFLIRSLLEQSSIYFLINNGKWKKWKKENNNRDLRLEKIISKISIDKQNLIKDDTISRTWETCFNNEGMKNYLDLVIHHPYKVIANVEAIKTITDMGMFAIIQYLINN